MVYFICNGHLKGTNMTKWEKQAIESRLYRDYYKTTEKYGIAPNITPTIKISNIKKSGGDVAFKSWTGTRVISDIEIRISKSYFEKFGYQRSYQTLMHEIAHLADFEENGRHTKRTSHTKTFQKWCVKFGGSLSKYYAADEYMDSTTDQYIDHIKWHYTCPNCNGVIHRTKRISTKIRTSGQYTSGCCNTNLTQFIETKVA